MREFVDPEEMTSEERLDEVAEILGLGISRLKARGDGFGMLACEEGNACLEAEGPLECLEEAWAQAPIMPMDEPVETALVLSEK